MKDPVDRRGKRWLRGAALALLLAGGGCDIAYDADAAPAALRGAAGHTMDLRAVETPATPVAGHVAGTPFTLERVEYHAGTTTVLLHSAQGHTVFVFLFLDETEALRDGAKIIEQPRASYDQPHVHVHWQATDGGRQSEMYTSDYVMRLEFDARRGASVPAQIYLCLPDEHESWLAGTFDVPVE